MKLEDLQNPGLASWITNTDLSSVLVLDEDNTLARIETPGGRLVVVLLCSYSDDEFETLAVYDTVEKNLYSLDSYYFTILFGGAESRVDRISLAEQANKDWAGALFEIRQRVSAEIAAYVDSHSFELLEIAAAENMRLNSETVATEIRKEFIVSGNLHKYLAEDYLTNLVEPKEVSLPAGFKLVLFYNKYLASLGKTVSDLANSYIKVKQTWIARDHYSRIQHQKRALTYLEDVPAADLSARKIYSAILELGASTLTFDLTDGETTVSGIKYNAGRLLVDIPAYRNPLFDSWMPPADRVRCEEAFGKNWDTGFNKSDPSVEIAKISYRGKTVYSVSD